MAAASAFKKEATAETPKDLILSFGQQGPPQMVDTNKKSDPLSIWKATLYSYCAEVVTFFHS